ncbi:hypothetical protein [Ralstonia solanacearum]|uniref:hypothetical protein n=1 Tax=Ralstonia solanacearum TaxID=305 RepID=UPI003CC5547E
MLSPSIDYPDTVPDDAGTTTAPTVRAQLTPDDWIRAAINARLTKSIDDVRVDVLAGGLGVTRGNLASSGTSSTPTTCYARSCRTGTNAPASVPSWSGGMCPRRAWCTICSRCHSAAARP